MKFVPEAYIVGDAKGQKFYPYTAIYEYSRFRYLEAFDEHSTHTSTVFLAHMMKKVPFKVECVQTDNELEFTKRLANTLTPTPTMFERKHSELGARHKYINPYTPGHM